jgi:hypothetical protein
MLIAGRTDTADTRFFPEFTKTLDLDLKPADLQGFGPTDHHRHLLDRVRVQDRPRITTPRHGRLT